MSRNLAVFNRKILVVDDNIDIRNEFKNIFETKLNDRSSPSIVIDDLDDHLKNSKGPNDLKEKMFDKENRPRTNLGPKVGLNNIFENDQISVEFEVKFASQGEEAIEIFKEAFSTDCPFCLVFMDVKMPPGMDGITCLERIREVDPSIEAVICTAYSDVSLEEIQLRMGDVGNILFLKKPFTFEEVFQLAFCLTQKWTITQRFKTLLESKENEINEKNMKIINASKLATLGEISTGIAHEINNPLSILQGYLEIIDRTLNDPKYKMIDPAIDDVNNKLNVREIVKRAQIAIRRIDKIIKGLKSLAHIGENIHYIPATLDEILKETLPFCDTRITRDSVEFIKEVDIPLDTTVRCNTIQISQVLLILINNSIDAICLEKEKWIKLKIYLTKETLCFELSDSGPGIPIEIKEKIFQPFFSTKSSTTGTGLGLSLAKGIVDAHHGKFYLKNIDDKSTFMLELYLPDYEKYETLGTILGHDN